MALGLIVGLGLWPAASTQGQSGPVIDTSPVPEYRFGDPLTFTLTAHAAKDIVRVNLYVRAQDDARTFTGLARFASGTTVEGVYTFDPAQRALSAFTPVTFWWEVADSDGNLARTDPATFVYADNRFDWQTLETSDARLAVHWYAGDAALGQAALDAALSGYAGARGVLPGAQLERADVYVYASDKDARAALDSAGPFWASGFANPAGHSAIVIADPATPEALSRLARDIPHEMMHLVAAQSSDGRMSGVPAWFNEGLAQLNEPTPNADAAALLTNARGNGELRALADYCGPFPSDPAEARLAYAHSAAVVRHIRNQYGAPKLAELLSAYASGLSCEAGVQQTLGLTLAGLDQAWQAGPAVAPGLGLSDSASGWLVLAFLVVVVSPALLLVSLGATRPVKAGEPR